MAQKRSKGKKREYDDELSSLSSVPPDEPAPSPVKRARRAETRDCPICSEPIPLRLMGKHAQLESERVDEILRTVGSMDTFEDEFEEGSSTLRSRRSAVKARKSMQRASSSSNTTSVTKVIGTIKRNRKHRHTKLREMTRDDEEIFGGGRHSGLRRDEDFTCPVCLDIVRGDQDVLDAHVDACLAGAASRADEERRRQEEEEALRRQQEEEEIEVEDLDREHFGHVGNVRGTGFHTRNQDEQDIEDEIDIDGDDEAVFGDAQFTEGDIVGPFGLPNNSPAENDGDEAKTLRDLIAEGKVIKRTTSNPDDSLGLQRSTNVDDLKESDQLDLAIMAARKKGDQGALLLALESKVGQLESMRTVICRICLDPYNEPTVSTGCWHTCCKGCWLRCLGSTKLCPICKRITGVTELRRIYM